jgi:hypothetical protein
MAGVTITLTPRLGLQQWSQGSDSPSRAGFNTSLARIDSGAAIDDGTNAAALPTTGVGGQALSDGRYAQMVNGAYRQLFRRASGAWAQVGGNTWRETMFARADGALATDAAARVTSHPSLTNPGATENWDGSSLRGGRQAVGDLNTGQPGAMHVGDTTSPVDLAVRGRVFARTTANNQRGFVASAHGAGAGNLFSAVDPDGNIPWTVDAAGRMRSQASAAFGAASVGAGLPLVSAPGANDLSAGDFYAATGKPAVRYFRTQGDTNPIATVAQDKITLGRSDWAGGRVDVLGPSLWVEKQLQVQGAAAFAAGVGVGADLVVLGAATITGDGSMRDLTARDVKSSRAVTAATVTTTDALNAHGGRFYTVSDSGGVSVMARPPVQYSGTNLQSLRSPMISRREWRGAQAIYGSSGQYMSFDAVMPEDGWLHLTSEILMETDTGASNGFETMRGYWTFELWNAANTSRLAQPNADHAYTVATDDTSRQIYGLQDFTWEDFYTPRLTAGNLTIRAYYSSDSILGGRAKRVRFSLESVVLHSLKATT